MEWAARIDNTIRGLGVQIVSTTSVRIEKPNSLVSSGLPDARAHRVVIDQELTTWREAEPRDYLMQFGFDESTSRRNLHAVYETKSNATRILIPALVLMRALFRPTRYLLPEMFRPQALDRIRFLDLSEPVPRVEFLPATLRNLPDRYGDVTTPIAWMSSFPSAMAFAASVHRFAMEGRIAVALPKAKMRLSFRGSVKRATFFATSAELLEVMATEAPLDWAAAHPRLVFRRATHVSETPSEVLRVALPLRSDGAVDVSDDEWRLIQPILCPPQKVKRRSRVDPRRVFDGVLRKLVLATAWRNTPYVVGSAANARFAYRQWKRSGALEAALSVLRRARTSVVT